jgi:hypothetical protein
VSATGHPTPAQIRSRLTHPVIDADGHWLEYGPVFGEQMRKVGGDRAADAFLAALRTTRESLSTPVDERSSTPIRARSIARCSRSWPRSTGTRRTSPRCARVTAGPTRTPSI